MTPKEINAELTHITKKHLEGFAAPEVTAERLAEVVRALSALSGVPCRFQSGPMKALVIVENIDADELQCVHFDSEADAREYLADDQGAADCKAWLVMGDALQAEAAS